MLAVKRERPQTLFASGMWHKSFWKQTRVGKVGVEVVSARLLEGNKGRMSANIAASLVRMQARGRGRRNNCEQGNRATTSS